MTNRNKNIGTFNETEITRWLQANGWPFAKRITQKGAKDEGDIELGDGIAVTVEAKRTKTITLSQWMRELADEMENRGNDIGFVVAKKRGTTDVGEYYAVMPLRVVTLLLKRAGYAPLRPRIRRKSGS